MSTSTKPPFHGRLLIVGWGSIAQGVLPLLLKHIAMRPEQVVVPSTATRGAALARQLGAQQRLAPSPQTTMCRCSTTCWARATFCSTCR